MRFLLTGHSSERLHFRAVNEKYFPEWLSFMKDPRTQMHWFEPNEPAEVKTKKWFERQEERYSKGLGGMNALIRKDTDTFIGHAGLLVQEVDGVEELEVAYSLLPEAWGMGYATEAARFCRDHAFAHGFTDSLISIIAVTNEPSKKVARRNGMTLDFTTTYKENPVEIYRVSSE
jgi:RimJ/RimL family protein N-acetyltransferase